MEIKEKIVDELKENIDTFEKYDNIITKNIEIMEKRYQERQKEFDEKWDEDIFPADIPIRDKEKQRLEQMKNRVKEQKQKLDDEIKEAEQKLKSSIREWVNEIDERRDELVQYVSDKNKYLEEKSLLEKELKSQIEGIQMWEKNGINPNDSVYRRRKDEIIPNLKSKIKDIDLKLDEANIRKEYKELGELKRKINDVKIHDRKHILPELADIFEINNVKPEPIKPEPIKPKPIKPEPIKPEPIKPEPVKPEPVKPKPAKEEQKISAKLIIGRKIKIRYADGKIAPVMKSKEYFKYLKDSKNPESRISSQLLRRIDVEREDKDYSLENIDSIITFSMLQALKKDLILKEDVADVIKAINNNDIDEVKFKLPIAIDKKDLSKGAFLPWNRAKRDRINKVAEENPNLIESIGEYEPNPFKRMFKQTKKLLSVRSKQEMITDGSEKENDEENSKPRTKLHEREDIKLSQAYKALADNVYDIQSKKDGDIWYKAFKEQIDKGNLSDREINALENIYKIVLKHGESESKEPIQEEEQDCEK